MSSLLTNTSAMTALQSLSMTQKSLNATEKQISTGMAISTASDNASYWSIATKMNSNVGALGAVSSALSESGAMLSTMSAAMTATISVMDVIKDDLISAQQPGADLSKIQTDISAQQNLLVSIGQSSNFNGQNFLNTTGATIKLVSSYDSSNGVSTIEIDTAETALFSLPAGGTLGSATTGILGTMGIASSASILTMDVGASGVTSGNITAMLKDVETALASITDAASNLGATQTSITTQQAFISNLTDSLTTGVGALVDADMNQASTKLSALQVQQQLGIQSLSIANSNTQMIMKLFQG
jgi:flagellin